MLVMIKMEIYKREWDKVAFYKKDSLEFVYFIDNCP